MGKATKIKLSDLYTGRKLTVKLMGQVVSGEVLNDEDCGNGKFCFSSPDGEEYCLPISAIVTLGK